MSPGVWTLLATSLSISFTACVIDHAEETSRKHFLFQAPSRPLVEVRLDAGSITVRGAAGREIEVAVTKRARGPTQQRAIDLLEQISVQAYQQGSKITVEAFQRSWGPIHPISFSIGRRRARSEVEIRLPHEADLDLFTREGRIEIEQVEGEMEVETEDGRLRLRDVKGVVRGRSADGSIAGSGLEGDFDVTTADGHIELEGRFHAIRAVTGDGHVVISCEEPLPLTRDWIIRSSDGPIRLELPLGLSAELEASVTDGRIVNDIDFLDEEASPRFVKGRLGKGGKLILLRACDGGVTLRSR
ncbi:MAG: DUF4097 domain-containing protein [Acidobacteriota bacterium]